jgi:hypothetical protein
MKEELAHMICAGQRISVLRAHIFPSPSQTPHDQCHTRAWILICKLYETIRRYTRSVRKFSYQKKQLASMLRWLGPWDFASIALEAD